MNDPIERQAAIDALRYAQHRFTVADEAGGMGTVKWSEDVIYFAAAERILTELPSAQPDIIHCGECKHRDPEDHKCDCGHDIRCLLAELFDDTCACNYNGIDEWLPEKCEVIDACPNPVGVACWEQYLTHREERRTDGN